MEFFNNIPDLFLHLDRHLDLLIADFGASAYLILFLIIFCETGLVVAPFLPGDSLLFAVGAFAARGSFQVDLVFFLLWIAAFCGDSPAENEESEYRSAIVPLRCKKAHPQANASAALPCG